MNFQRIDDAIASCEAHLDATGTRNSEVEQFLVGFILVAICADFEMCLEKIIETRATKAGDAHLVSVLTKWAKSQSKRMKISDLSGCLKMFGQDYKDSFDGRIKTLATSQLAYDNIHTNRNLVAHQTGTSVTLAELKGFFTDAKPILTAVSESMGFTATEIAALTWP